jgi:hypothetical protein
VQLGHRYLFLDKTRNEVAISNCAKFESKTVYKNSKVQIFDTPPKLKGIIMITNEIQKQPALKKVWFLDPISTDCPIEIENIIRNLWGMFEFGNDNYFYSTSISDLEEWDLEMEDEINLLISYLKENGIQSNETVLLHYWW